MHHTNGMAIEMHITCNFASSWKWLHGFSPVVSSKMETWQVRPTDKEQTLNTAAASERGSSAWHISLAEEVIAPLFPSMNEQGCPLTVIPYASTIWVSASDRVFP